MTFTWEGIRFEGPFREPGELLPQPGVFVIWCDRGNGWAVLEIGQADDVRAGVRVHGREDCWRKHCAGEILYAACYGPGVDDGARRALERRLRAKHRPPCGEP